MWKWKTEDVTHKIVRLSIEEKSPFGGHMSQYNMYYQGWSWGACSCATLWNWNRIPERLCNEETLASFIRVITKEVVPNISSWNPHRVFAQVPKGGADANGEINERSPWFEYLKETVYPGTEPVYVFDNRSHKSTSQRLFDLDTDKMVDWLRKYDATHPAKPVEEKPAAPIAASSSNIGTIINANAADHGWGLPPQVVKLNNGGQRPLAPGEYFTS